MARLDPSRTAIELNEAELTVAGMLLDSPREPKQLNAAGRAAVDELERVGISENGKIEGYPARLLEVLLAPELRVVVERYTTGETQRDFAAKRGEAGVWGESRGGGSVEYTPIEPDLIAWSVARNVGLGPRRPPAIDRAIELRGTVLQETLDLLAAGEPADAERLLAEKTSLDEAECAALLTALIARRLSWRLITLWEDEQGTKHAGSVAVIDGGDGGLWFSQHLNERSKDPIVRLEPTDPSAAWERIVALLPAPAATDPTGAVA